MAFRALSDVLLGLDPGIAREGEVIPASYVDQAGDTQQVDFDRLVALGAAEKVEKPDGKSAEKAKAKPAAKQD